VQRAVVIEDVVDGLAQRAVRISALDPAARVIQLEIVVDDGLEDTVAGIVPFAAAPPIGLLRRVGDDERDAGVPALMVGEGGGGLGLVAVADPVGLVAQDFLVVDEVARDLLDVGAALQRLGLGELAHRRLGFESFEESSHRRSSEEWAEIEGGTP
jgi:hypothetical protein